MLLYINVAIILAFATFVHKFIKKSFLTFKRTLPKTNPKEAFGLQYEDVFFKSVAGTSLHGWFVPAATDSVRGCVVLTPGWTLNTEYLMPLVTHIHSSLGFHCLLMEARFHGLSEGDNSGMMNAYKVGDDIMSGVQYAATRRDVDPNKIGVVGFSFGAGGSMRATSQLPLIKFAVAISGFANFRNVILAGQRKKGVPDFITRLLSRYLVMLTGFTFESVAPVLLVEKFRKDIPVLVAHGDADAIIPYTEYTDLECAAKATGLTKFHGVTIEGARHMNVVSNPHFIKEFNHFLQNVVKPVV